jgi:hypothetical protein
MFLDKTKLYQGRNNKIRKMFFGKYIVNMLFLSVPCTLAEVCLVKLKDWGKMDFL